MMEPIYWLIIPISISIINDGTNLLNVL